MKYKVLKTCHAGGRMCREGKIIEFPEKVDNKYLELVVEKKGDKKEEVPERKGQPLSSLSQQPANAKTGMAAKREDVDKVKQEGK